MRGRQKLLAVAATAAGVLAIAVPSAAQAFDFPAQADTCYPYTAPHFEAEAGKPFSGIVAGDPYRGARNPSCGATPAPNNCQITRAVIHWGDGTDSDATEVVQPALGTTSGAYAIKGSHVYRSGGEFLGAVDLYVHCTNNLGQPYDARQVGQAGGAWGFRMTVAGACSTGAQSALARAAQCFPPYFPDEETIKKLLDRAADTAFFAADIDKVIADAIDNGGKKIKEALGVNDASRIQSYLAGKLIDDVPYSWLFNVPRYAEYIDIVKGSVLRRIAKDPPDSRFAQLAPPPSLGVLRLKAGHGVSARRARTANRTLKRLLRENSLRIGLLVAVERAAGAHAAGEAAAESAQLRHAAGFALELAGLLKTEQKALRASARALRVLGRVRISPRAARRAKRFMSGKGIARLAARLRALGFSTADINATKSSLRHASARSTAGRLATVLGFDAQARFLRGEERGMRAFAARHANGA